MNRRRLLGFLGLTLGPGCLRLSSEAETEEPVTTRSNSPATTPSNAPTTAARTAASTASEPGTEPEPTTESEPTTEPETETDAEYPLGLETDGVSPILADAHQRTLSQTTFRIDRTNEDLVHGETRERTYRVDGQAPAAIFTSNSPTRISKYLTDAGTLWCQAHDDGTLYGQNAVPFSWLSLHDPVEVAAKTGAFNAPERIADDPPVWRVSASGIADPARLLAEHGGDSLEAFSATLEVTAESVVRSLSMEFDIVDGEELRAERVEQSVSAIGELTMAEPDWVATARENAAQLSAKVADNRTHVVVNHNEGNPVPPGTVVAINQMQKPDGSEIDDVRTSDPFEVGQSMYIYATNEATRIAFGSMPNDANPREIPENDEVWFGLSFGYAQFYHSGAAGVLPYRPERQS